MALYKYNYEGKYKYIIQDWGDREYCEELEYKIDEWLEQFREEDKIIALRLLGKFQMYRQKLLSEKIHVLYNLLLEQFEWAQYLKTFFMLVDLKDKISNSMLFACEFQKTTGININRNIIGLSEDDIESLDNKIVFIDDYSGSGSNFIESIDLLIDKNSNFRNFEFVFLVVNISEIALTNISEYAKENRLKIKIIHTEVSSKAFKENYIFNTREYKIFKEKYYNICKELLITSNPFGFMNSEALIAFDKCVPNNNLSMFREKSNIYNPLIYRERPNEDYLYKMNKEKKNSYLIEHQFKNTKPIFNFNLICFIIYCIKYGQRLNISKTCKKFGMTATQYNDKIKLCLINDLIKIEDERYILGNNFDKVFLTCRINKNIVKIARLIINDKINFTEETFCDIINYTPVDFENRFKGYAGG